MEEKATNEETVDAVAAYQAASEAALKSTQRLNDAWMRHFEEGTEQPSPEWIFEVAAQQMASELALGRARAATAVLVSVETLRTGSESAEPIIRKTKRTRRRENKALTKISRPGQRFLRAALLILILLFGLVAISAGISLALEVAGILGLIDDPVRLPVGSQLGVFGAACGLVLGLRRLLKPVERVLFGSKGVRPKVFQL